MSPVPAPGTVWTCDGRGFSAGNWDLSIAQFDGAQANSARLVGCLAAVAQQNGCEFLDTAELIAASDIDGIHLEESAHRTLGLAVAQCIREIINARG